MTEARLFRSVEAEDAFAAAVEAFRRDGGAVPVWVGPRADLTAGLALAEEVYAALRVPPQAARGHLFGEVPEAVRRLAEPLAAHWSAGPDGPPDGPGSVLLVGTYAALSSDRVRRVLESAHRDGRDVSVLTGRDVHSLSWTTAKQYGQAPAGAPTGVFTDNDSRPRVPGDAVWLGPEDIAQRDVQDLILSGRWGRLLFNGHGRDDNLNLGQFTLCGRSPAVERAPGALGPQCAYGLGCYKPEDKLVPAHRIPAAEIVLNTCLSGPLSDLALYDPAYQILLNALDGPAQTVVAALTTNNGDRPENLAWLRGGPGSVARRLDASAADINPYPAFLQVGLGTAGDQAPEDSAAGQSAAEPDEAEEPWALLGGRVSALLHSGLLPGDHALRPRLERLHGTLLRDAQRGAARPAGTRAEARRSLDAEVAALDLALAQQIARGADDPLLEFPIHFGERSRASAAEPGLDCACGRPVWRYRRVGRLPVVPETYQSTCLRCGDVENSFVGAPALRVESADKVALGGVLPVTVEVTAVQDGIVNVGLVVPSYVRATIKPPVRRLRLAAGENKRTGFEIAVAADAEPQAYYHQAYAVQGLALTVLRFHFGAVPGDEFDHVTSDGRPARESEVSDVRVR
ncbi:hypothetical protein DN069_18645 [Streptacidiphilus pinicola]|uniref:Uncharacterized protein n=1 Tax=Streptacidiphilus pinicola TaxID=2219663 RepID=A0A2X0K485_9ACTN|nr:hypothetical protein [Streptacidiphilus pinicola]RAG84065.1 hypothetical protein DN069_18645 [Streptacidiphilus pinicola]